VQTKNEHSPPNRLVLTRHGLKCHQTIRTNLYKIDCCPYRVGKGKDSTRDEHVIRRYLIDLSESFKHLVLLDITHDHRYEGYCVAEGVVPRNPCLVLCIRWINACLPDHGEIHRDQDCCEYANCEVLDQVLSLNLVTFAEIPSLCLFIDLAHHERLQDVCVTDQEVGHCRVGLQKVDSTH